MESNIINIATLTIDKTEANNSIEQTKKQIFDLQKANSDLRKDILKNGDASGEQTKKFVENEQALKQLNAQYRTQSAAINDLTLAELKSNKALSEGVKSIAQATAQNRELNEIKKQINLTTAEGVKAMELINAKMDENTKFIKANDNADEKRISNIGKYPGVFGQFSDAVEKGRTVVSGFTSTVAQTSDVVTQYTNSAIQGARATLGFKTSSQLASEVQVVQTTTTEAQVGANEALTVSQTAVTGATNATTTSMKLLKLAIIATGIGAIVILALSLVTALKSNEEASNKLSKAFAAFKGIANAVLDVLRPLGEFLIDKIVAGFELAGKAAEKGAALISKGLSFLGFDEAAKSVDKFTGSIKKSIKDAQTLSEAEAKYANAKRLSQKIQLDYQKTAEKLRQLRDDESKSTDQRIKANEQLGATLKKQQTEELKIANQALAIANLRIKLEGKSTENLDARAEALTTVSDIQERISGQESEQLQNLNSLRKEAADKEKERQDKIREARLKTLNDGLIAFELEKNSVDEQLKFYTDYYAKLNELQGGTERIANANALSQKVLSIAEETLKGEIDAQKKAFEEKKNISETEKNDLIANAQFLRDTEIKRVNESILSERDKAIALEEIQKGYLDSITIINANYDAAEKDRQARRLQEEKTLADAAFQLKLLALEEQGLAELELQKAQNDLKLEETKRLIDEDLALQKISATEAAALKNVEEKKYASANKKINKEIANAREATNVQMVKDSLTALNAIFGENKATAVAAALVNTYEGISAGVKLGYPAAIPAVAAAAATGFAAVKNILSTKKGDTGGGGASSSTGVQAAPSIFENPARTQTIATVNAPPPQETTPTVQPVLVLESLDEVKNGQQIKIKSGGN
jgi:hypothetical protein